MIHTDGVPTIACSHPRDAAAFADICSVEKANRARGSHWFDPDTMRFFNSRIESPLIAGRYFVTSEQMPDTPRAFTLREALPTGEVVTVGGFLAHDSLVSAVDAIATRKAI